MPMPKRSPDPETKSATISPPPPKARGMFIPVYIDKLLGYGGPKMIFPTLGTTSEYKVAVLSNVRAARLSVPPPSTTTLSSAGDNVTTTAPLASFCEQSRARANPQQASGFFIDNASLV